jgi:starch synthase
MSDLPQVKGLLNGIDTTVWDPTRDTVLPAQYSPLNAAPKALCKEFVMKGLGMLTDNDVPLVVCVSRLVPQKGIHLIKQVKRTVRHRMLFLYLNSPSTRSLARTQCHHPRM